MVMTYQIVPTLLDEHPDIFVRQPDPALDAIASMQEVIDIFNPLAGAVRGTTGPTFQFRGQLQRARMTAPRSNRPSSTSRLVGSVARPMLGVGRDGLPVGISVDNGAYELSQVPASLVPGEYTISFAVRIDADATRTILSLVDPATGNPFRLEMNALTGLRFSPARIEGNLQNFVNINGYVGQACVITISYGSGVMRVRINGVQVGTVSWSQVPQGFFFRFGGGGELAPNTAPPGGGFSYGMTVVASRDMTSSARIARLAQIEAYLMSHYGVTA